MFVGRVVIWWAAQAILDWILHENSNKEEIKIKLKTDAERNRVLIDYGLWLVQI